MPVAAVERVDAAKAPCRVPVPGCGARGRWQGLAGLRGDAPSEARSADDSRAGRRPRAHQAARPHSKTLRALHTGGACRAVSTAARPCLRPRALQPGPAGPAAASNRACLSFVCCRPGPAAALGLRSQAQQLLHVTCARSRPTPELGSAACAVTADRAGLA